MALPLATPPLPDPASPPWTYRIIPAAVALCLFFTFTAIYLVGDNGIYIAILRAYGIVPFKTPFLDIGGVLAAWDCTRQGIAVIAHDPCDVIGRAFNNSPFWLAGDIIPLGMNNLGEVGWGLDLLFLLTLTLLPPVHRRRHLALVILATISPMVVFAVERANPDIILFMLAILTAFLAIGPQIGRIMAYVVILFAASLKYYPASLLLLTLRERPFVFVAINLIAGGIIAFFILHYLSALELGIPLIPGGLSYGNMFGAINIPLAVADIAFRLGIIGSASTLSFKFTVVVLYELLLLGVFLTCWRLRANRATIAILAQLSSHERMFLLVGSILIVSCFFAGQSVAYRGIYLLMILPGLLAIAGDGAHPSRRRLGFYAAITLLLIMWSEAPRLALLHAEPGIHGSIFLVYFGFWFVRELGWWWLIGVLTAIIFEFMTHSRSVDALLMGMRATVKEASG